MFDIAVLVRVVEVLFPVRCWVVALRVDDRASFVEALHVDAAEKKSLIRFSQRTHCVYQCMYCILLYSNRAIFVFWEHRLTRKRSLWHKTSAQSTLNSFWACPMSHSNGILKMTIILVIWGLIRFKFATRALH